MSPERHNKANQKKQDRDFPGFYFYSFLIGLILLFNVLYLAFMAWDYLASPPTQAISLQSDSNPNNNSIRCVPHKNINSVFELECTSDATEIAISPMHELPNPSDISMAVRDLYAQEGMWKAANAMAFFALGQVLVGCLAGWFIVLTFRNQRKELGAANIAAKAAIDTLDAAITKDSPNIRFGCICTYATPQKTHFKAIGYTMNVGQTAALDVKVRTHFIYRKGAAFQVNGSSGPLPFTLEQLEPFGDAGEASRKPIAEHAFDIKKAIENEETRIYFVAEVTYNTIFNQTLTTRAIYRLDPISVELFSFRHQLKLLDSDSCFTLSDEQLHRAETAARDPANISRFDVYECNESLALSALEALDTHRNKMKNNMGGIGMPNFGTRDDDE